MTATTATAKTYGDYIIGAEQQPGGRWKFTVHLHGERMTKSKSLRTWATKAGAIRAGRREFRV